MFKKFLGSFFTMVGLAALGLGALGAFTETAEAAPAPIAVSTSATASPSLCPLAELFGTCDNGCAAKTCALRVNPDDGKSYWSCNPPRGPFGLGGVAVGCRAWSGCFDCFCGCNAARTACGC